MTYHVRSRIELHDDNRLVALFFRPSDALMFANALNGLDQLGLLIFDPNIDENLRMQEVLDKAQEKQELSIEAKAEVLDELGRNEV